VAVAVLAAAEVAILGQPAAAAPPAAAASPAAAAAPPAAAASPAAGAAGRPAPVDPHGPARRASRHAATAAAQHTTPNPLLKEVLAEEEEGDEDAPAASALCQSFLGKPNPYDRTAPGVDQIVNDPVVPVGSQAGCNTPQNETTIAVNPANPRNLVAGANDYRLFNTREARNDSSSWAYTSSDRGRTWTNQVLPKLNFQTGAAAPLSIMDAAGDPAIAFGPRNTVYFSSLVFSRAVTPEGDAGASGITVSVSRDGGRTFGDPVIIQVDGVNPDGTHVPTTVFNDKNWIAADPDSGTVYVTWTRFVFDEHDNYVESPIVVSKSTDFGQHWSAPRRISPTLDDLVNGITPFAQGSNPRVGRDGTLYVAYEASVCETVACDQTSDHDAVIVATSRDGGRAFRNVEAASDFDFPATLTGENFRLNSFPQLDYDRHTDQLWITWADDSNGQYAPDGKSIRTNGDVFVITSTGGRNWSRPLRLGTGADEFFPAVAVFANRVAVSYYTRGFNPTGISLDYAYSAGWGRGIEGAAVRRITTQGQDPRVQFVRVEPDGTQTQGVFIGDYSAITMSQDFVIHPCWTDFRGNPGMNTPNQDAYSQSIWALF
jgi:hypothetical protein